MVVLEFGDHAVIPFVEERVQNDLAEIVEETRDKESLVVGQTQGFGDEAGGCPTPD